MTHTQKTLTMCIYNYSVQLYDFNLLHINCMYLVPFNVNKVFLTSVNDKVIIKLQCLVSNKFFKVLLVVFRVSAYLLGDCLVYVLSLFFLH